jgi:hypothetical protein
VLVSRCSDVGYSLGDRGVLVWFQTGTREVSLLWSFYIKPRALPSSYLVGAAASSAGHEADHFSPYSSRVQLMSGAVASQPLCLSGVRRDNFMGGVGAKGSKCKGTKQNESKGYTCGKSGWGCIFTWCMVHLPATVFQYVFTSLVKWEVNIYRIWQYCSVKKITVCWNVIFSPFCTYFFTGLVGVNKNFLSYLAPLVMFLTWT